MMAASSRFWEEDLDFFGVMAESGNVLVNYQAIVISSSKSTIVNYFKRNFVFCAVDTKAFSNIICVTPVLCAFFPLVPIEIAIRAVEEDKLESVTSADSLALGKVVFILF